MSTPRVFHGCFRCELKSLHLQGKFYYPVNHLPGVSSVNISTKASTLAYFLFLFYRISDVIYVLCSVVSSNRILWNFSSFPTSAAFSQFLYPLLTGSSNCLCMDFAYMWLHTSAGGHYRMHPQQETRGQTHW